MEEMSALITRSQKGDKAAREALIENNLGLVHAIVKRFVGRGLDQEDLFQIGVIGLIKAIDKFDLSYEVKFSTYAVPLISGEIKRFLRDDGPIKVSRTIKEHRIKIHKTAGELQHTLGREPTIRELADAAGLDVEDVILAQESGQTVESLYAAVYLSDGSDMYLIDKMAEKKPDVGEVVVDQILLKQLINGLDVDERRLIYLRFFQNKKQIEVARILGISQVQVSRLEKKILLSMRKKAQLREC